MNTRIVSFFLMLFCVFQLNAQELEKKWQLQSSENDFLELKEGTYVSRQNMTVKDYLENWLIQHQASGHVRENTAEKYAYKMQKHIIPKLGNKELQKIEIVFCGIITIKCLIKELELISFWFIFLHLK